MDNFCSLSFLITRGNKMLGHFVFKTYGVLLLLVMAGACLKGAGRSHCSLTFDTHQWLTDEIWSVSISVAQYEITLSLRLSSRVPVENFYHSFFFNYFPLQPEEADHHINDWLLVLIATESIQQPTLYTLYTSCKDHVSDWFSFTIFIWCQMHLISLPCIGTCHSLPQAAKQTTHP